MLYERSKIQKIATIWIMHKARQEIDYWKVFERSYEKILKIMNPEVHLLILKWGSCNQINHINSFETPNVNKLLRAPRVAPRKQPKKKIW